MPRNRHRKTRSKLDPGEPGGKRDKDIARSVGLHCTTVRNFHIAERTLDSLRKGQRHGKPPVDEGGIPLIPGEIQKRILNPNGWLDDNMINRAMNFINKEHPLKRGEKEIDWVPWKAKTLTTWTSQFIGNGSFTNMKSMTKWMEDQGLTKGNQPQLNCVIIPWHHPDHWTLALVFPLHHKIALLDSLAFTDRAEAVYRDICTWLHWYMEDDFEEQEWSLLPLRCPQQENGHDCGAHVALNALFISKGIWPMAHKVVTPEQRRSQVAYMVDKGTEDCPIHIV